MAPASMEDIVPFFCTLSHRTYPIQITAYQFHYTAGAISIGAWHNSAVNGNVFIQSTKQRSSMRAPLEDTRRTLVVGKPSKPLRE